MTPFAGQKRWVGIRAWADLREAAEYALAELGGLESAELDKWQRENLDAAVRTLSEALKG